MNWKNIAVYLGLAVLVAPFVAYSFSPYVPQYKAFTVSSGSMSPGIPEGSIIYTEDVRPGSIGSGDVITFRDGDHYTTHRVVETVQENDGGPGFRTKGDANDDVDPGLVEGEEVVGKVFFSLPYLGNVVSFARTLTGTVLLVMVPAGLLVLKELYHLSEEVR